MSSEKTTDGKSTSRKIVLIIIAAVILLSVIGHIVDWIDDKKKEDLAKKIYNDGTISFRIANSYSLKYIEHEFGKNTFGTDCITVYFMFENLSDKDKSYSNTVDINAYQDGIKLELPFFSAQTRKTENYANIRSNASVEVCSYFTLRDESTSPVEITVSSKSNSSIIDHMFIPLEINTVNDADEERNDDSNNHTEDTQSIFEETQNDGTETQIEAARLSDFYLNLNDDGTISIKAFETHDEECYISETYIVDGRTYHVKTIDDACFFGRTSLKTISIPEGVTSIANNAFNSCNVETLYLPSTLNEMTGVYEYLHDRIDIYYAGTEAQWKIIRGADNPPANITFHFNTPVIGASDETNYSREQLTLEKTASEELGNALGNALNGLLSGMLDD